MGSQEQHFCGPHREQQPPGLCSEVPCELPYTIQQNTQEPMEVRRTWVWVKFWGTWLQVAAGTATGGIQWDQTGDLRECLLGASPGFSRVFFLFLPTSVCSS